MPFGFSRTRRSPIAIDFGADSLKLLQIVPGEPPQLAAAACEVLPAAAREDPYAREAFLAEALPRLLRAQPFKGRRAICALPAFQTLVQHLEVPRAEGAELESHIEQQLRQRLDIDPRRMVVRHIPLGPINRPGSQQMEVLCLAAPRDAVMRYIELARRVKLDVVGMHSEPLCLLKAFEQSLPGVGGGKPVCYIDIGAASTKVVIVRGGQIKFAKTIQAGGDQMTRHYATAEQLDFDEARRRRVAEALGEVEEPPTFDPPPSADRALAGALTGAEGAAARKVATGLPTLDVQAGAATGAGRGAQSSEDHVAETLECVIDELQLSLRYYQRLCPDAPVERLVFLGGESRHVSTCQRIARSLRIAAQLGDPLAGLFRDENPNLTLGVELGQPQPGWAVPFGLCLSEANL